MARVVNDVLRSSLLKRKIPYRVVIPEACIKQDQDPPVLYLLHGLFGTCDNWIELTELLETCETCRFIIVTPEGESSWYVDSETNGNFESAYLSELIPAIDEKFQTCRTRGIAGLSMGGFGAIKFALRRPELFKFAISTSGAFQAVEITETSENWDELKESVMQAFGQTGSAARESNDLKRMIAEAGPDKNVPPLFIDCGTEDSFLQSNRDLGEILKRSGLKYSYKEFEGGHDWDYWNARLGFILKIAAELLS